MGENGQSFARIAKSFQDQTVGSAVGDDSWIAIDWVTCRSANNICRLNVQSGHCNPQNIEESSANVIRWIKN